MFADACSKAKQYARPVIDSIRTFDGTVTSTVATFVVLNSDGWIVTSGHIFDNFVRFQTDQRKINELKELKESSLGSDVPDPNPDAIVNHSFWWGWDGVVLRDAVIHRQLDICIGRLENFNSAWVETYPVLGDPDRTRCGMSLCRLGFPFLHFDTDFDVERGAFRIPRMDSQKVIFPNDCICTRHIDKGVSKDGKVELSYVETSTPGLKGQSGGPIVDTRGNVRAIQVSTTSFSLDFHPVVNYNGQQVVESQFMNIGLGVDIRVVRKLLDERGIRYVAEGDESGYRIIS